ncbi:hypothetical protein F5Y12DRAFT_775163 [Xylaria sp. FL1777]|nr:hypothetical protein F5Y12DRAFT_775163 [Xylaria sp. FL1777]
MFLFPLFHVALILSTFPNFHCANGFLRLPLALTKSYCWYLPPNMHEQGERSRLSTQGFIDLEIQIPKIADTYVRDCLISV